ncbi:hypothetical protein ACFWDK_08890 [Micromonospora chalcea]|uniref:hypothetical protein n=1 Tax=Micromonospora sp. TSRI0369 TaxID=1703936 RepID=UPI000ADEA230|nr:hypothetical protein [Micromonospora sp. TSRI0369]
MKDPDRPSRHEPDGDSCDSYDAHESFDNANYLKRYQLREERRRQRHQQDRHQYPSAGRPYKPSLDQGPLHLAQCVLHSFLAG